MAKTYMEMATELVTAQINRGMLTIPPLKGNYDWKARNLEAVKTTGWAVLETYKELSRLPVRAQKELEEEKKNPPKKTGITLIRPPSR